MFIATYVTATGIFISKQTMSAHIKRW